MRNKHSWVITTIGMKCSSFHFYIIVLSQQPITESDSIGISWWSFNFLSSFFLLHLSDTESFGLICWLFHFFILLLSSQLIYTLDKSTTTTYSDSFGISCWSFYFSTRSSFSSVYSDQILILLTSAVNHLISLSFFFFSTYQEEIQILLASAVGHFISLPCFFLLNLSRTDCSPKLRLKRLTWGGKGERTDRGGKEKGEKGERGDRKLVEGGVGEVA